MGISKLQSPRPTRPRASQVTVDLFGEDHWSLFAYIKGCCEVNVGRVEPEFMRCNWTKRTPASQALSASLEWSPTRGTRLRGYNKKRQADYYLSDHDDWDCLRDLEAAGFLEVICYATGLVHLTPLGMKTAAALQQHTAQGGHYTDFSGPTVAGFAGRKQAVTSLKSYKS